MPLAFTPVSNARAQPGREAKEPNAQLRIQNVSAKIVQNQKSIMVSGIVTQTIKDNGSAISSVTKKRTVLTHL